MDILLFFFIHYLCLLLISPKWSIDICNHLKNMIQKRSLWTLNKIYYWFYFRIIKHKWPTKVPCNARGAAVLNVLSVQLLFLHWHGGLCLDFIIDKRVAEVIVFWTLCWSSSLYNRVSRFSFGITRVISYVWPYWERRIKERR